MDPSTIPTPITTPIVVPGQASAAPGPSPMTLVAPILAAITSGGTPSTIRRAVAAAAGVLVPFVSAWTTARFGFGLDPTGLVAVEGLLTAYIAQAVVNDITARSQATAMANAATPAAAILDLNRGPAPVAS